MSLKRRRVAKKLVSLATASTLMFTVAGVAEPATAAAKRGCQNSELLYVYYKSDGSKGHWVKNCSGRYPLNSRGYWLYANGWSGTITQVLPSGPFVEYFCDGWTIPLVGIRVIEINMYATKHPACLE